MSVIEDHGSEARWRPVSDDGETLAWWDGHAYTYWARRVEGDWTVGTYASSAAPAHHPLRSALLIVGGLVVAGIGAVVLLVVLALFVGGGAPSPAKLRGELDAWKLPATVVRVRGSDVLVTGDGFTGTSSVRREYRPRGVDATTAARDLVRRLRAEGYRLEESAPGAWTGPGATERTTLTVAVMGSLISVALSDDG